jgi:hypothetical protein
MCTAMRYEFRAFRVHCGSMACWLSVGRPYSLPDSNMHLKRCDIMAFAAPAGAPDLRTLVKHRIEGWMLLFLGLICFVCCPCRCA